MATLYVCYITSANDNHKYWLYWPKSPFFTPLALVAYLTRVTPSVHYLDVLLRELVSFIMRSVVLAQITG